MSYIIKVPESVNNKFQIMRLTTYIITCRRGTMLFRKILIKMGAESGYCCSNMWASSRTRYAPGDSPRESVSFRVRPDFFLTQSGHSTPPTLFITCHFLFHYQILRIMRPFSQGCNFHEVELCQQLN